MNVDSETIIRNLEGEAIIDHREEKTEAEDGVRTTKTVEIEVTLGHIVKQGLLAVPRERNISADLKRKRYGLAKKFIKGGIVELSKPEIDMIRDVVGEQFIPVIVGRVDEILDHSFEIPHKTERMLTSVGSDSAEDNQSEG